MGDSQPRRADRAARPRALIAALSAQIRRFDRLPSSSMSSQAVEQYARLHGSPWSRLSIRRCVLRTLIGRRSSSTSAEIPARLHGRLVVRAMAVCRNRVEPNRENDALIGDLQTAALSGRDVK